MEMQFIPNFSMNSIPPSGHGAKLHIQKYCGQCGEITQEIDGNCENASNH